MVILLYTLTTYHETVEIGKMVAAVLLPQVHLRLLIAFPR